MIINIKLLIYIVVLVEFEGDLKAEYFKNVFSVEIDKYVCLKY